MRGIEVFHRIEDIEPYWRALEAEGSASPFQRFDWMAAHIRTISAAEGAKPALVMLRDRTGTPAAILPLERVRRGAFTLLRSIGGKHASFHLALATHAGAALIATDPLLVLREAAKAAGGADLILLRNQPREWLGAPNPFSALMTGLSSRSGSTPTASSAYETELPADAEAFIRERSSAETRKKLRKKRAALAESGAVVAVRAQSPQDIALTLEAFFAQKRRRFAAQGIANPFSDAATQGFLRAACDASSGGPPAIELHALHCGERIVAVFGLAPGFSRVSGMFTSFDDDPVIARHSPGDLLLHDMVRQLIVRGFERFDLGIGEARYKNSFCRDEVALTDVFLPLTFQGRLVAAAMRGAARLKAAIKRDPRLLHAATRVRGAVRRFS